MPTSNDFEFDVFLTGERFDVMSVRRWRDAMLGQASQ
jgi:hypothetical protein